MKLVFLDVDGVLNNDDTKHRVPHGPPREGVQLTHTGLEPACIARLNGLIARAEAGLVLSSTWRLPCTCDGRRGCPGGLGGYDEAVRVLTEHGVTQEVKWFGPTPDLRGEPVNGVYRPKPRGEEVATWLHMRGVGVTAYVVLDDGADMRGLPEPDRFVQIDSRFGLTDEDVSRAEAVLARVVR